MSMRVCITKTSTFCCPLAILWCNHDYYYYQMMIDWLKKKKKEDNLTPRHLHAHVYDELQNVPDCMYWNFDGWQNWTTTVVDRFLWIMGPFFSLIYSLLGMARVDWTREEIRYFSLSIIFIFFSLASYPYIYTRANWWSKIQMWTWRTCNCKNNKIKIIYSNYKSLWDIICIQLEKKEISLVNYIYRTATAHSLSISIDKHDVCCCCC
jgi:hypothetical protein